MSRFTLILLLFAIFAIPHSTAHPFTPPLPASQLVAGLAYGFYHTSCPHAESIVRSAVHSFLAPNISQAGALIRLAFHDCFVQGCDASVLITANGELAGAPDLTLRPEARALIDQIKVQLEESCPNIVSCADTVVLAGREATYLAGGPFFDVPTGRLDSLAPATVATELADLPAPTANFSVLMDIVTRLGLDKTDLVALSGAHTVGLAHCAAFNDSILPTVQNDIDASFAQTLLQVCPNAQSNEETVQDYVTPNVFDNQYYINLLHKQVLFDSDRALLDDQESAATVAAFAASQKAFFQQFAVSFVKMSQMSVRTATTNPSDGNIRKVCSVLNGANVTVSGMSMLYTAKDSLGETE